MRYLKRRGENICVWNLQENFKEWKIQTFVHINEKEHEIIKRNYEEYKANMQIMEGLKNQH